MTRLIPVCLGERMDEHFDLAAYTRARGHRLTSQRRLIFGLLRDAGTHLTAVELCRRVQATAPAINRATVYRTLDFLVGLQLVTVSALHGQTVFEVVDEVPHHHLVCRCCGRTEELTNHPFRQLAEHLRREHGFKAEFNHLTIGGLCRQCQAKGAC